MSYLFLFPTLLETLSLFSYFGFLRALGSNRFATGLDLFVGKKKKNSSFLLRMGEKKKSHDTCRKEITAKDQRAQWDEEENRAKNKN